MPPAKPKRKREKLDNAATTPLTAVIVTGGASGIGRACAISLAAAGRPVAVWDRDGAGARRVANQCADEHGVPAVGSKVDVKVTSSLRAAVRRARNELGPVGGLVHAAGTWRHVPYPGQHRSTTRAGTPCST